ncbi:hypothetical protein [Roseateles sp. BYS96W]|uniref:Uncharacterized protein n=1 Tax=Pelomonas nitida TaxID=3299027 RepID=A0ABW7G9Z6_9BURK
MAKLRTPAAQVGVMLLPPPMSVDAWEERASRQQSALLLACSEDRGEEVKLPDLPDPMTRANRSPSR